MRTIAIDFDGTIVDDIGFPEIGKVKPFAKKVINRIIESGNEVIIWTCREPSEIESFLLFNGINYTTINENTKKLKNSWGNDPRKVGAYLFIDDKNIFCKEINWYEIYEELGKLGIIRDF